MTSGREFPEIFLFKESTRCQNPTQIRPGRRLKRKNEASPFPLRRPALLAALGLCGVRAPAGAAAFPPTLESVDGTNGFRLVGVAARDISGRAVSSAGDVNGDGLADLPHRGRRRPQWQLLRASYVVFGRDTAETGPFPASLDLFDSTARTAFAWTASRPVTARAPR